MAAKTSGNNKGTAKAKPAPAGNAGTKAKATTATARSGGTAAPAAIQAKGASKSDAKRRAGGAGKSS